MRILFLGQNPAKASPNTAFVGTRSGKRLEDWIRRSSIPLDQVIFANVSDKSNTSNKPIAAVELAVIASSEDFLKKIKNCDIVFLCGKQALQAMNIAIKKFGLTNIRSLEIPHPSGLNRKLNDQSFVNLTIKQMSECYESVLLEKMEGHK